MRSLTAVLLAGSLLGASCSSSGAPVPQSAATGPSGVRTEVVERHAEQFDTEVPVRPAGSQEELIAATYLSGHLQLAGYVVFLDGVPVRDLVRSTNVVARAPSGEQPEVVVTVPYDTVENPTSDGLALGLFLELARALRVIDGAHGISFTALGAERVSYGGGNLGSRRAAQELLDDEAQPLIVSLGRIEEDACVELGGDSQVFGASLETEPGCTDSPVPVAGESAFAAAGFEHVTISGDPTAVGAVLLEFLAAESD